MEVISSNFLSLLGSWLHWTILFWNDADVVEIVHKSIINEVMKYVLLVAICNLVDLIFEFMTSEVTDLYVVSWGQGFMLWYLHVSFLCPEVLGPIIKPITYYVPEILSNQCDTCWNKGNVLPFGVALV